METVVLVLVIAAYLGAFVVGTGYIADRKGYNFVVFAAFGLFFGLLALIVAAVLPKSKKKKAEEARGVPPPGY